jgi:PelA/Pel-15E family pectate lyase
MISRHHLLSIAAASVLWSTAAAAQAADAPSRAAALDAMKRATTFMVDEVSYNGGFVWSYLPDRSRIWGEMEAKPTMVWVQPPGTATMGHLFLDAYKATGDEFYYQAAEKVAGALIWGQHPSGGWNYMFDFAGEGSLRHWYDTIGRNGWRLEEFHHYYGNATFDDEGTSEASQFLLRLYVEKRDPRYRPALERAIQFVLDSQYPIGGWPQRFPLRYDFSKGGNPDYTSFITFNDDVAAENIKFLIMVYQALGEPRVLDPINRAMNSFLVMQLGQPQPAWALQYTLDLQPAGARTYEPKSLVTHTTAENVNQLMNFYQLTGETKFLARIPEALGWLDSVRLPRPTADGRTHPTFIEIGTNRPLYVHRRGSNVVNGEYYVDYEPANPITHYGQWRRLDVPALRRRYEELKSRPVAEVAQGSPLRSTGLVELPRFFALRNLALADLNTDSDKRSGGVPSGDQVARLIAGLNREGYWPTPLRETSNPYIGGGSPIPAPGDFSQTLVGDRSDTSPFVAENPVIGISLEAYIRNMNTLVAYVDGERIRQK